MSNRQKKFIRLIVTSGLVFFILSLGVFFSCTIGLGPAVDIDKPNVTFDYPSESSVIMEDFVMSGFCSDDIKVKSVVLSFENLDRQKILKETFETKIEESADKKGNHRWSCVINRPDEDGTYPIPDGRYQVTATVTDEANRTNFAKWTIEIDNTPPLVLLSDPITRDADSVKAFGRLFNIKGQLEETHTASSMSVFVKKFENNAFATDGVFASPEGYEIRIEDYTSMSESSPLRPAAWYSEDPTYGTKAAVQKEVYRNLYGTVLEKGMNTDKLFYYSLLFSDTARKFKDPSNSDGEESGNVTTGYYIATEEMDTLTGENSYYQLDLVKIKNILDGSETYGFNETELAEINRILSENYVRGDVITKEESLCFTLNPDNNPVWNIANYELDDSDSSSITGNQLDPDGNFSIMFNAGKDAASIDGSSIEVKLIDVTENEGETSSPVVVVEKGALSGNISSLSFTHNISLAAFETSLKTGHVYRVEVSGCDIDENTFVPESGKGYGFKLVPSVVKPVITLDKEFDSVIYVSGKNAINNGLTVTGKVVCYGSTLKKVSVESSFSDSWDKAPDFVSNPVITTSFEADPAIASGYIWTAKLSGDETQFIPSEKGLYTYNISITCEDNNSGDYSLEGQKDTRTVSFIIDSEEPTVAFTENHKPEGSDAVNGIMKITASAQDNNRLALNDSLALAVYKNSEEEANLNKLLKFQGSCDVEIDSSEYEDGTKLIVYIIAEDFVGNKAQIKIAELTVDQDTDKPVIKVLNADQTIKTVAEIRNAYENSAEKQNIFGESEKLREVNLSVSDDDGISEVVYKCKLISSEEDVTQIDWSNVPETKISEEHGTASFMLPSDNGIYAVNVSVKDINGNIAVDYFVCAVDSGRLGFESKPLFVSAPAAEKYFRDNQEVGASGKCSGTNISKLVRTYSINGSSSYNPVEITLGNDLSWNDSIKISAVSGSEVVVTYTVSDVFGKTKSESLSYTIDGQGPEVFEDAEYPLLVQGESIKDFYNVRNLIISNYWTDSLSGVSKICYWLNDANPSLPSGIPGEGTVSIVQGKAYSFVNVSGLVHGDNVISLCAEDAAGNRSECKVINLKVDVVSPVIENESPANVVCNGIDSVVLSGKVSDSGSGLSYISFMLGEKTVKISSDGSITGDTTELNAKLENEAPARKWTLTINPSENGMPAEWFENLTDKTVYVEAGDIAGNSSGKIIVSYVGADLVSPVPAILNVSSTLDVLNESKKRINKTSVISGTTSDNISVKSLALSYRTSQNGTDWSEDCFIKKFETLNGENCQTWSYKFDTSLIPDGTFIQFAVEAEDNAGNSGSASSAVFVVDQNTDIPELKLTNVNLEIKSIEQLKDAVEHNYAIKNVWGLNGKITGTLADDDGIESFSAYYKKYDGENDFEKEDKSKLEKINIYPNEKEAAGQKHYTIDFNIPEKYGYGIFQVYVVVEDVENAEVVQDFVLSVDAGLPSLEITNKPSAYVNASDSLQYEGIASDENWDKMTRVYKIGETVSEVVEIKPDVSTGLWTDRISLSDAEKLDSNGKTVSVVYTATDKIGQKRVAESSFVIDNEPPEFTRAVEKALKTGISAASLETHNSDLWFRNSAIYMSGYVDSDLSGVKNIKYWIKRSDYTADAVPSGTVIPVKEGSLWKFQMNLSGFEQGQNEMVLVAADNAGNQSQPFYVTVKIDSSVPEIKTNPDYDLFLRNGKEKVEIRGKAKDIGSGIQMLSMKFNEGGIVIDNSGANSNGYVELSESPDDEGYYDWTATFICSEDGSVKSWFKDSTVTGTVMDRAGNASSTLISTMLVDTVDPESRIVSVSPILESESKKLINKTLKIEGIASDANGLESTVLTYSVYDESSSAWGDYVTAEEYTGASAFDWKFEFDTETITAAANETALIKFRVVTTDKAGNTRPLDTPEYTVDQNSDRPEIIFADISVGDMVQRNIISGSVIDDDGGVNMWYCIDDNLTRQIVNNPPTLTSTPDGWHKINVVSTADKRTGNWTIDLSSEEDGEKYLFFFVIDSENKSFRTSDVFSAPLNAPFVTDRKQSKQNCLVVLTKDTKAPEIAESMVLSYDGENFNKGDKPFFGGNFKTLYTKITVKETTAMPSDPKAAISLSLNTNSAAIPVDVDLAENSGSNYTYIAGPISLDDLELENGFQTLFCTVSDAAGKIVQDKVQLIIDNEAPSVTVSYPDRNMANSGTLEMNGLVTDNVNGSGVCTSGSVYMLIPTKTQVAAGVEALPEGIWGQAISQSSSWTKSFNSTNKESANSLSYYVENDLYGTPVLNEGKETGWYDVPVWFKTVDELGNTAIDTTNSIRIDRYSFYPNITIKNPVAAQKVGSTITVYGSAFDNEGFDESKYWPVRVQFDANGDGLIDSADFTELKTAKWAGTDAGANVEGSASDWYIKASGTTSWRLKIDTGLIPNTTDFKVRACVYDSEGHTRGWSDVVSAVIDIDSPQITDFRLAMYRDSDTSFTDPVLVKEVLNTTAYVSSPFDGCKWYLEGSSSDNNYVENIFIEGLSGNTSMKFTESDAVDDPMSANKITAFRIPFGSDYDDGSRNIVITATDNNNISTSAQGSIVIDTTAPSMFTTGNVSKAANIGSDLRITTNKGTVNYDRNTIENSNSVFTFGDKIVENTDSKGKPGSGIDFVAFYFSRGEKLYRPVASLSENIFTDNLSVVGNKTEGTASTGEVFVNNEGLVAKLISVTQTGDDNKKLVIPSIDKNIRNGGMVKINNRYIGIKSVNGTSVELKEDPGIASSAQFIYAQIVDHFTKESAGGNGDTRNDFVSDYDGGTGLVNDDGDGMVESLENKNSLTEYEWSASVFSDYITDGPIELHVVVMDKAGNSNHGYVSSKVENRRPRITKVLLATDLNNDGKFTYSGDAGKTELENYLELSAGKNGLGFGEFMYYSALDNSNKASAEVELNTIRNGKASFSAKNKLLVLPEFTGGNGSLKYKMVVSETREGAVQSKDTPENLKAMISKTELESANLLKTEYNGSGTFDVASQIDTSFGGILLENSVLDPYDKDDVTQYMAITFWDETDGLVQGTTSQWSLLTVPMIFDTKDSIKPVATIDPFKWIDKDHNNTTGFLNPAYNGKGHIEYPEGWKKANGYKPAETTGEYDADPKVSGAIRITGTAYDNTVLKDIYVALKGFKFDGKNDFGGSTRAKSVKLASYKPETNSWNYEVIYTDASTGIAETINHPTLESTGYEFKIIEGSAPSQEGHSVKWQLDIDTTMSSKPFILDVPFVVYAVDGSGNEITPSESPKYRVDIVPYITKVTTKLSALGDDPSVFARSSTGAYQIYAGHYGADGTSSLSEKNNFEIEGYNLFNRYANNNSTVRNKFNGKGVKNVNESVTKTFNRNSTNVTFNTISVSVTLPTDWLFSGEAEIFGSGYRYQNDANETCTGSTNIYTLNNVNNNDEEYNFYDNEVNNNHVDDDVVFDVWAARYGLQKTTSEMRYPSVKINPTSGQIGVGAADASYAYRPGYKDKDSTGNYYSSCGDNKNLSGASYNTFTYDRDGNSFGIANYVGSNDLSKNGPAILTYGVCVSDGKGFDAYAGGQYNGIRLESGSVNIQKEPTTDAKEWNLSYSRTRNPNMVAQKQADGSTMVHTVYYDAITRQVRYRRGRIRTPQLNGGNLTIADGVKAFSNDASDNTDMTVTNTLTSETMMEAWDRVENGEEIYNGPYFHDISDVEYKYSEKVNPLLYTDIASAKNRKDTAGYGWAFPYHTAHTGPNGTLTSTDNNDYRAELPDSVMTLSGMTVNVIAGGIDAAEGEFADIYLKKSNAYKSEDKSKEYYPAHEYKYGASEYTALGVLSDGRPVIAWYEPSRGKVMVTTKSDARLTSFESWVRNAPADEIHVYADPADTDDNPDTIGIGTSLANIRLSFERTNSWEVSSREAGNGGKFVQMTVDKEDIVHMVYVDEDADQLKYTRFTVSNDGTFNFQGTFHGTFLGTWVIDGYSIDGYCTINVGYPSDADKYPYVYVGYMSGGYAKSAVLKGVPGNGFENNSYTGTWEIATVPTLKNISKYNVSTAEYVDTAGLLKISTPNGVTQSIPKGAANSSTQPTPGILYGNGTANPVIGYGTADGNVDIAQIR
ncbi:MAG: hypothetical protein MJ181_04390 [Treponema sp.]|nr:hypothetical protein [Treponema sp.]